MILQRRCVVTRIVCAFVALAWLGRAAVGETVEGLVDVTSPEGQFLSLKMTIDDVNTRFEITGPSFSWFAFGFDTTTMKGYSIIVEGVDDTRSLIEQNLVGIGSPGVPQASQDLELLNAVFDVDNYLTTVVLTRPNDTGDASDPVFSPSMTSLDLIFAYNSSATPAAPVPTLNNHGRSGRGFDTITFEPVVPEPASGALVAFAALALAGGVWRRFAFSRNGVQ